MKRAGESVGRAAASRWLSVACVAVAGLMLVAASGCTAASGEKAPSQATAAKPKMAMKMKMASTDTSSGIPRCYECSGKGTPPSIKGAAMVSNGMQMVDIKVVNGYYSPNIITAKAGVPLKVMFMGKTVDCAGKPKFGSLNKQVNFIKTGSGTIDLGTLAPGTYKFTCGMGSGGGTITVQ